MECLRGAPLEPAFAAAGPLAPPADVGDEVPADEVGDVPGPAGVVPLVGVGDDARDVPRGVVADGVVTDRVVTGGALTGVGTRGVVTDGVVIGGALTGTFGVVTEGVVRDGVLTVGGGPTGVVTWGVVAEGTVTEGTVTCGVVTVGTLTEGTVTCGVVTVGTGTVGVPTVGVVTEGRLRRGSVAAVTASGLHTRASAADAPTNEHLLRIHLRTIAGAKTCASVDKYFPKRMKSPSLTFNKSLSPGRFASMGACRR